MSELRGFERLLATAGILAIMALQVVAVHRQSLVFDAPYHLAAGHQALRYGTNTLNLEHPPLPKMVAAAPLLLGTEPLAPPRVVTGAVESSKVLFRNPELARRGRIHGRSLLLIFFGLPFLLAAFLLGRQLAGCRAGVALTLSLGFSLSVLPFLSIVTTDAAVSLAFLITLIAAVGLVRAPRLAWATGTGLGLGLALSAKFSGVLLVPTVVLAVVLAPYRRRPWPRRLLHLGWIAGLAVGVLLAGYLAANWRYDPEAGRDALVRYAEGRSTMIVGQTMEPHRGLLLGIERFSPGAAQWLTGLLSIQRQNALGVYPSYAFGEVSSHGRWWYFPVVLAIKSPLAILAATLLALIAWLAAVRDRQRRSREPDSGKPDSGKPLRPAPPVPRLGRRVALVVASVPLVYLAMALSSNYNLGVRYLLPVLPVLYLPAAVWMARRPKRLWVVLGLLLIEAVLLAPAWMSATNTWWLGEANPTRFVFLNSNTEYGQNSILLAEALEERGIGRVGILFPGRTEAEIRLWIPGAWRVKPVQSLEPGWYAVNVVVEKFIPAIREAPPGQIHNQSGYLTLAEAWGRPWEQLVSQGEDHGYVAATFHLYRLPE